MLVDPGAAVPERGQLRAHLVLAAQVQRRQREIRAELPALRHRRPLTRAVPA